MKRVFDNATILYGEELEEIKGYLVLKDGVIQEVGEGSYPGPSEDVKGGIISPSFTNSHVHLGDSAGQDVGTYLPLVDKVGRRGIKYKIHKNPDAKEGIVNSLISMKESGTTAFCDFREGGVEGIKLLKSVLNMSARILGRPNSDENIFKYCDGFGISSIKDYSEGDLERILSHRGDKLVGIHSGECSDDIDAVLSIEPDFLVHLSNASEESLKKVFKKKIPVVLCPRANAAFGVGIADLESIFAGECLIALGTDNVMANSTNMLREMEFLWKLYRGLYTDYSFDARIVLRAATINGRKLLKLPDNSIKEGNQADFLITRRLKFTHDPVLAMIHRVEVNDIKEVVSPEMKKG
jgi:cytosine/adenosine deaminase-related metal-dependent hydrolase